MLTIGYDIPVGKILPQLPKMTKIGAKLYRMTLFYLQYHIFQE